MKLENFDLSHVPVYIMDEETLSLYAVYMATLGNREDLFPGSGYVNKYIKPPTTYDIPSSALEDETFAAFITEAEKYIGYPYVWGGSNPNTSFDCSGFVSWVLTQSGVCNTGRLGAQGLYNISTPVSSANARPGDLIFFVGTYDTPGVSHVGIYVGGGKKQVQAACRNGQAVCTSVTREKKKEQPPKLYDLTTLQREANRIFGYTAKQTLDYAQSLYEKKLLTYPRTDSRYLTSDMAETASCVIHLAAKVPPFDGCSSFFPLVETMISDKDVSDHHAIIPTMEMEKADIKGLPVGERNLLLLVCCKLLCAAAEPYVYETVTATFECGGHTFTAKGKRIVAEGWREIERIFRSSLKEKPEDTDNGGVLPDFTEGQAFEKVAASVTEHFTSPPKPYTEDTLLSAMENAGKEGIPDDAERKGLGTPATRAAIIEKLVSAGFVERKGKSLIPTKAGINLVTVLPEPLTSPMLTAEWEQRLTAIAKGEADPGGFLDGIRDMVRELVTTYSQISEDGQKLFAPEKEVIGACPRCGKPVYEGRKNFSCSDRACGFVLWKNDRFWTSRKKELTKKMAADLLKKGRTNVKGMWSEKNGATYDAAAILDDTGGKFINFKLEFPKRKDGANGRK